MDGRFCNKSHTLHGFIKSTSKVTLRLMSLERGPVETKIVAELAVEFEQQVTQPEIDKPQDECGVFAMYAPDDFPVGEVAWNAGVSQEHRGNSGSGMAYINPKTELTVLAKGLGRLREAIPEMSPFKGITPLDRVKAKLVIIHNRYSTAESNTVQASQPFVENRSTEDELTLAHNGHLDNDPEKGIDALAIRYDIDPGDSESDSHLLTMILAKSLKSAKNKLGRQLSTRELALTTSKVLAQVNGAYCLTMFYDGKVIGARDTGGVHPLMLGTFAGGKRGAFASETVAFKPIEDVVPLESTRVVKPGELIVIDEEGIKSFRIPRKVIKKYCQFEYFYIADENGELNGAHVRTLRRNIGKRLAETNQVKADMVVGVPSTGLPYADGYADESGIPKVDAITKQKNAPRTFLKRGAERARALKEKFIINAEAVIGKSLVVVDDSTIKGNTARQLIQQLRDAGAREVHFRFASEPYISSCNLGMDTSDLSEFIARGLTNEQIAAELGADSVAFGTLDATVESIDNARVDSSVESVLGNLCMGCTKGDYGEGIVPAEVAEERRLEAAKRVGLLAIV